VTLNQGQAPPPWVCLLVALAGVPVGLLMSRRLVTGGYRLDDELGQPPPTVGWLVAAVVPALWGVLAWRVGGLSRGAVLPAYLLLAAVGVALFWVDVDVHRLPEALTLPCLPAVALLLAIASATTGDWGALARAVACGVAAWVAYVILALAVPGGLGLGDATLGASCRWRWATSPGGAGRRVRRGLPRLRRRRAGRAGAAPAASQERHRLRAVHPAGGPPRALRPVPGCLSEPARVKGSGHAALVDRR